MYSFYFISNDEEIREKLNKNGYTEYPQSKQYVHDQIASNDAKKASLCRDQQFIDIHYLLHNLLEPNTTNLIMHKGDVIVGILNFLLMKKEVLTIEDAGICVDRSESKGAGTLLLNYLKLVSSALDAKQIKIFIVDNSISPFYEKNGFRKLDNYYLIFNIDDSTEMTIDTTSMRTTSNIATGIKSKSFKRKPQKKTQKKTQRKLQRKTQKKSHKKKPKTKVR